MEELEPYLMVVDESMEDDSGMNMISLVKSPAMKSAWRAFNSAVHMKFDKRKRELVGALIVPGMKIPREEPGLGRFNVVFPIEAITTILRKFQRNNYSNNINLYHSDRTVDGFVQEIWMKEFNEDKSNAYGLSEPIGTLFAKVKIEDERFWDEYVETDEVRGFSIEILSGMKKIKMSAITPEESLFDEIGKVLSRVLK